MKWCLGLFLFEAIVLFIYVRVVMHERKNILYFSGDGGGGDGGDGGRPPYNLRRGGRRGDGLQRRGRRADLAQVVEPHLRFRTMEQQLTLSNMQLVLPPRRP